MAKNGLSVSWGDSASAAPHKHFVQIDSRHLQVLLFVFLCLVLERKFAQRGHVYLCLLLDSTLRTGRFQCVKSNTERATIQNTLACLPGTSRV